MVNLLITWLITAVAVYAAASFVPGITVRDFGSALIVALVLGLLNAFVKPVLVFLTLPVTIVTLGLFLLVINALILYFVAYLLKGFEVNGFVPALLGSIVISIVSYLLSLLLK
ncbi:MAG: phage holin family protein [Rhizobacter sp.]|nr:phage holin family protein [Chlorobiales bacterium]